MTSHFAGSRTELHHRQIDIRFFERSDGLFEVEGRLLDRKAHPFRRVLHDRDTPAGEPLHDIEVRLVIDESLLSPRRLARLKDNAGSKIDSCYAYASQREVVARLWPDRHKKV